MRTFFFLLNLYKKKLNQETKSFTRVAFERDLDNQRNRIGQKVEESIDQAAILNY